MTTALAIFSAPAPHPAPVPPKHVWTQCRTIDGAAGDLPHARSLQYVQPECNMRPLDHLEDYLRTAFHAAGLTERPTLTPPCHAMPRPSSPHGSRPAREVEDQQEQQAGGQAAPHSAVDASHGSPGGQG